MESMGKIKTQNYIELVQAGISGDKALQLQKISRALHRIDEANCTYDFDNRRDKRERRLEKEAEAIATEYGFISYHQHDPRGWSLYLVKPDQLHGRDIRAMYNEGIAVCPH